MWVKINVDAAVFGGSIGCGAIIRNADGIFWARGVGR